MYDFFESVDAGEPVNVRGSSAKGAPRVVKTPANKKGAAKPDKAGKQPPNTQGSSNKGKPYAVKTPANKKGSHKPEKMDRSPPNVRESVVAAVSERLRRLKIGNEIDAAGVAQSLGVPERVEEIEAALDFLVESAQASESDGWYARTEAHIGLSDADVVRLAMEGLDSPLPTNPFTD